jgi:hypothetical protein
MPLARTLRDHVEADSFRARRDAALLDTDDYLVAELPPTGDGPNALAWVWMALLTYEYRAATTDRERRLAALDFERAVRDDWSRLAERLGEVGPTGWCWHPDRGLHISVYEAGNTFGVWRSWGPDWVGDEPVGDGTGWTPADAVKYGLQVAKGPPERVTAA